LNGKATFKKKKLMLKRLKMKKYSLTVDNGDSNTDK
jgi:hypothetical protein